MRFWRKKADGSDEEEGAGSSEVRQPCFWSHIVQEGRMTPTVLGKT